MRYLRRINVVAAAACLAIFHSPDNRELRLETQHIQAVRPADAAQQHLAPGTGAIIYVGSQKFGVVESAAEIDQIIKDCITDGEAQ
jgi:hypothetical protein